MRTNLLLRFIKLAILPVIGFGIGLRLVGPSIVALAQAPANWFSITNGDTTCHAHLVSTTGYPFYFVCSNPRGAFEGTYTPVSANTATDVITFGLSAGVGDTGNNICMVAINVTTNPVTIGSFGSIPAQSVGFQCAGSAAGVGQISIAPIASLKGVKKK
jgi:hypothetical protein